MKYSIKYENNDFYMVDKHPNVESFEIADEINNKNNIERNGLIHRLDKDTSGLMVIAKNNSALITIQKLFKDRKVNKSYLGLVWGKLENSGQVELNISRDPKRKKPMKITQYSTQLNRGDLRSSKTSWRVKHYYQYKNNYFSLVKFSIFSGRTHQIRLTANYLHHPIIGDKIYFFKDSKRMSDGLKLERQFLHSYKIGFKYKNKLFNFQSDLPADLKIIIDKIGPAIEK
ncbi:MAG: Pseudouridine synthase [Berkelbacteria bacterium GW2011_GWA2_35_9]|uniref:Pseudouridine synthase n=1 Tax=Berkelbacteria bacterium GW2011_GWA2_35_9 TaxID=1618333 RepID=A0A0G0DK62_9BACT|nr:MAG: Pseudouridine synthase [Berkelbacteria bacterium GW2011_GWA2_35_9]